MFIISSKRCILIDSTVHTIDKQLPYLKYSSKSLTTKPYINAKYYFQNLHPWKPKLDMGKLSMV